MKKVWITLLTIQFLVFGSSSAWAQSPVALEDISTESSEETQVIDIVVDQDQKVNTGGTADEIEQEQKQELNVEQSQDQSTSHEDNSSEEESNEEAETGIDEANEEQVDSQLKDETVSEPEENNETNQADVKESDKKSEDSKIESETTPNLNDSYTQEQKVEVIAEQTQKVQQQTKLMPIKNKMSL